jgi:hypothetical protein
LLEFLSELSACVREKKRNIKRVSAKKQSYRKGKNKNKTKTCGKTQQLSYYLEYIMFVFDERNKRKKERMREEKR